ncbi:MAG: cysteine synthase family protein [Epsilonproteobacteria bacterium]|nr:cysteine synthase family protein [Campylobacterota bacterium]
MEKKIAALEDLIGNTPLLEIEFLYKNEKRKIYAKAEYFSLTGSIKDRMALHIIKKAYAKGEIKPGYVIAEATSGNTGISFAAIGRALGHRVIIFMPNWMSEERVKLIKSFGAEIHLVDKKEGGFIGSINKTEEMAAKMDNVFLPRQFSNIDNIEAHYSLIGPEIWQQMEDLGVVPDAFVAGVGTGGTIMGTGEYLKEKNPDIKLHPVEPASSPTLSTGHKVGFHRIEGISDEFIPSILRMCDLDEVLAVDDGDAIIMAQKLARELGIGVGISSGANFLASLLAQEKLSPDANVVTVFADDNKKYLSTDLFKEEPLKDHYLSKDIKLLSVKGVRIKKPVEHKKMTAFCESEA